MYTFITVIHIIAALLLVLLVILQSSKSDATAFLGGSTSNNIFGGKGPISFITKTTVVLVAIFFLTSYFLAITQRTGSIVQNVQFPEQRPVQQPINPTSKGIPVQGIPINATPTQTTAPASEKTKANIEETGNKTPAVENKTETKK